MTSANSSPTKKDHTDDKFIMLPTVDVCFKSLMNNPKVRKGFIAALLNVAPETIAETTLLPTALRQDYPDDKLGILDVRVLMEDRQQFDMEMQVAYFEYWDARILFYLSKIFTDQLKKGEPYENLKKCIHVSILDFIYFEDDDDCHRTICFCDEKTGKIIEHIEALPIMAPRVTKYKYNDKNQLIQTTLTNRDYREITDYNPQTELPQHSERHYFSQEENPEARSASYGADYYTEYVYDSHNRLIKEKTFNKRDNRFEYGKKYNPETGKTILEASRGHATHYDKDGDIDIERTTSYPNTVKTLYYDKEQAVPYREIYKDGNNYRIDRIYKPDKEKYNNNLHRIESQKLLTRTHSDLDEYHFKKLINRFTQWNVISIQKDYTDDNYDIYKIKLPKNSQQDDF